ncbi:AI-2E family transporter [Candidatus Woesearchaeota archaeon]|nr:AI-2E family transporter [Candidatus Woesearchaeota archaeon]
MKRQSFSILISLLLAYLIFLTVKPFISAILFSFVLAFVFSPLYAKLNSKINSKSISSAFTLLIILFLAIIPSLIIANSLAHESVAVYQKVKEKNLLQIATKYLESDFQKYISGIANNTLLFIAKSASNFILSIPQRALNLFIIVFLTYYLLKESSSLVSFVKKHLPLDERKKTLILEKFKSITGALIYGIILTAIIQGVLGGIGFAIFNIPSPILWGFVMAFASLIPFAGTALIWLPAGIIQIIQQDYFSGVGIIIFGALVVGTVDNLIKPKLIGRKANIHPTIILLGILGGLNLLGFIGLIIGPLILAISLELLKLKNDYD